MQSQCCLFQKLQLVPLVAYRCVVCAALITIAFTLSVHVRISEVTCDEGQYISHITQSVNKKLRYREEHSASVVLSCVLYDISREKICCFLINHFYLIGHEGYLLSAQ